MHVKVREENAEARGKKKNGRVGTVCEKKKKTEKGGLEIR